VLAKAADLHRRYARKGLVVLGLHVHEARLAEVEVYALRHGIDFPMGNGGYNNAYKMDSVPHVFLVDPEGILVWEGKDAGGDLPREISKALRNVDWFGEASLPRALNGVKRLVAARRFGRALEALIDFRTDPKAPEEERAAAEALQKKLEDWGEREYVFGTSAIRTRNPARGVAILERIAEEFAGQPAGRKAQIRLKEIRKDEELKPILQAAAVYDQFRDLLKAGNERGAASKAAWLVQKHADSLYAARVRALLEAYDKVD
jgi:hypothetical protein